MDDDAPVEKTFAFTVVSHSATICCPDLESALVTAQKMIVADEEASPTIYKWAPGDVTEFLTDDDIPDEEARMAYDDARADFEEEREEEDS